VAAASMIGSALASRPALRLGVTSRMLVSFCIST
jgi:hypothetical protein